MINRITGIFFISCSLLLIHSCKNQEEQIRDLKSSVWIHSIDHLPDSMNYVEGNYLVFDSTSILFNGHPFGEYLWVSNDTLTISEDEEKRRIVFKGIIEKQTTDSLILKRLKGGFPIIVKYGGSRFDMSEHITFFNQKLLKKNAVPFDKLSFSASSCFGTCPEMSCEIDNQGNIKFHGGTNSNKQGYFIGKVNKKYYDQIVEVSSYISTKYDTVEFSIPMDAPEHHLLIEANGKSAYFSLSHNGSYKLVELCNLLRDIVSHSQLQPTKNKTKFKTEIIMPVEQIIEFLPPVVADES